MAAVDVYTDLAGRGITLSVRDDGRLWVAPGELLTDADRTAIRHHRDQLLELAALADDERCSVCPRPLEVFDPTGVPWCDAHCPDDQRWQLDEPHTRAETLVRRRLHATPIVCCRLCAARGARLDDGGLCACCRAYTRRFNDPHDPATPTREEAR